MLSGIAVAIILLGMTLVLFGLIGVKLKFVGTFLLELLGEFAQGIAFATGVLLLIVGISVYPTQTVDRSLMLKGKPTSAQESLAEAVAKPVQLPVSTVPGTVFRDCPECPEMVVLPVKTITIGAAEHDAYRTVQESPAHPVTLHYSLGVGRFEVSFAEWSACAATGGGCRQDIQPPAWGWHSQHPVVNVNWNDAQLYLAWLKTHTGYEYRLLSEAEWEYAARAGQVGVYAWGDAIGDHHANCLNCGGLTKEEGTRAVGSFAANGYSIFDMHGNVREWVADCWHENYQGAPQDGSAWVNQCSEASRVVRGGAWNNAAQDLRAAARHREIWDKRADNIGFRVARVVP